MPDIAAALRSVTKQFGAVTALNNVTIEFEAGKVHALLGENGSGKSTSVRVLTGAHSPSTGSVEVAGQRMAFSTPREGLAAGIVAIYQDAALVPGLTVAENIFLGHEGARFGVISNRSNAQRAERWLRMVDPDLSAKTPVSRLSIAGQQLVAIAKALSQDARVLILDEPTASLGLEDTERLFTLIRGLKDQGLAIVYITHRLKEVEAIADTVTILKDGVVMASKPKTSLAAAEIVRLMVGREITDMFPARVPHGAEVSLDAVDVRSKDGLVRVDRLTVRSGEILGIAGLDGSGRSTLAQILGGVTRPAAGTIALRGNAISNLTPSKAIRMGIGYVPPDRRRQAIVSGFSVASSVTQSAVFRFTKGSVIRRRDERAAAQKAADLFNVKAGSLNDPISTLSGGNQQKVILGRALCAGAHVLVCDEPTAGVDIGARGEIYAHLARLAQEGMAVVVSSSEMPELMGLCHRIVVIREGAISLDAPSVEVSEEDLMRAQLPASVEITVEPTKKEQVP